MLCRYNNYVYQVFREIKGGARKSIKSVPYLYPCLLLLYLTALPPDSFGQVDEQRFIDSMEVVLQQVGGAQEKIAAYKAVIDQSLQSNQGLARYYIEELRPLANAAGDTATLGYIQEKEASSLSDL